jgi:predicted GNAT family acetyltransferase
MSIDHTGVPKALGARGIGLALVRRAVEDARKNGYRINPLCPFVGAMARRHPEMQYVVIQH